MTKYNPKNVKVTVGGVEIESFADEKIKEVSVEWGVPIDKLLGSNCTRENIQDFLKVIEKGE